MSFMKRIASWFFNTLSFLRLRDPHDGLLSITNIAVIVAIVKIAWAKDVSIPDLTALLGCLGLYHLKRKNSSAIQAAQSDQGDTALAMAEVTKARAELKEHNDKLRMMMDTMRLGMR